MFNGALTALVTPFRDGEVDERALRELVEFQIQSGIDGLVPCGSTGESATLTHSEHDRVISIVIHQTRRRVPVVAGTGSNSTAEAIRLTASAREAGADGALMISPYYNKPTQDGIFRHYKMIAAAVDLPIIVYNIPGRTGSHIAPETFARLSEIRNIAGIKEASGSMDQVSDIRRLCGDRLTILSGDDALTLPMMAVGARGVISVTSNVLPAEVARVTRLALEGAVPGNWDEARRAHLALLPVHEAMFVEANPSPAKAALAMRGVMKDVVRGPLAPCSEGARKAVAAALEAYGKGGR